MAGAPARQVENENAAAPMGATASDRVVNL
jgi:hypothetical protein